MGQTLSGLYSKYLITKYSVVLFGGFKLMHCSKIIILLTKHQKIPRVTDVSF